MSELVLFLWQLWHWKWKFFIRTQFLVSVPQLALVPCDLCCNVPYDLNWVRQDGSSLLLHEAESAKQDRVSEALTAPPGGLRLLYYTTPPRLPFTRYCICNQLTIWFCSGLWFKWGKALDCLFFGTFNKMLVYKIKLPSQAAKWGEYGSAFPFILQIWRAEMSQKHVVKNENLFTAFLDFFKKGGNKCGIWAWYC